MQGLFNSISTRGVSQEMQFAFSSRQKNELDEEMAKVRRFVLELVSVMTGGNAGHDGESSRATWQSAVSQKSLIIFQGLS